MGDVDDNDLDHDDVFTSIYVFHNSSNCILSISTVHYMSMYFSKVENTL